MCIILIYNVYLYQVHILDNQFVKWINYSFVGLSHELWFVGLADDALSTQ